MWCAAGSAYGHSCMLCMVSFCENLTLISNGGIEFNRKNNIQQEQVLAEHPQISYRHVNNLYIYIYIDMITYTCILCTPYITINNNIQQPGRSRGDRGVSLFQLEDPPGIGRWWLNPHEPDTYMIYNIIYIYIYVYIIIWYMYNLIYIYLLYIHYTYH